MPKQPNKRVVSYRVSLFLLPKMYTKSVRKTLGPDLANRRQPRQLDSSTAEAGASMHELVAPLDGMALFEVHPSRKVSLDKCSHQGSAHWHQSLARCALHPGVICPRGWRSLHLCTVMGCFPPIGGYTKSGAMLVVMAKKMPHHGAAILGGTPSLWSAWMERTPAPGANDPWMEGAPCKAYCCQNGNPLMATLVKGHSAPSIRGSHF